MENKSTQHAVGEHNVEVLGLDVHHPVFPISAILTVMLVVGTLLFPAQATAVFGDLRGWITTSLDWFFIISGNLILLFLLLLAISPLGKVRLGGPDARPHYTYPGWFAMLFAAGVGIGLMFFGVLEPVTHTLNPPLGIDPADVATARAAGMSAAIFHWGLHAWAFYGLVALSLAFFCFNRNLPLTLRSAFFPIIGERVWGWPGHIIDISAVLATLLGLAVSLGYGAEQIAGGLDYLMGTGTSNTTKVLIIVAIISVALISVVRGLDKGVKMLSELNMILAAILLLFVFIAGPTLKHVVSFFTSTIDYIAFLPPLSNWVDRTDTAFLHDWTTFYWAWWISWSPFVGMFIARVSFGRSVREFIVWVLIAPTVVAIVWMSVFGGTALEQLFSDGYRGVADSVAELALFRMLEQLPFSTFVSGASVFLIALFFITSADSGSLVIDTITAGGKMDAPVRQRVFWCVLAGLVSIALMLGGGMASLQALTISVALPFCIVMLFMCIGLFNGLRQDRC